MTAKSPRGSSTSVRLQEVALVAQEGELVLVVRGAAELGLELAGARQHRARLADQVERHVGQRDVFLEHRRVAAPFGEALRVDQAGVADAQQVLHRRVAVEIVIEAASSPAHMWSSDFGSS